MGTVPSIESFLPSADHQVWEFTEYPYYGNGPLKVSFIYNVQHQGATKIIQIDAPASHKLLGFFDRMTLTPGKLELNRLRFGEQLLNLNPPLIVTTDVTQESKIDVLLPANSIQDTAGEPIPGVVREKVIKERPKHPGIFDFNFKVFATPRHFHPALMTCIFHLATGEGIIQYYSDNFGPNQTFKRV